MSQINFIINSSSYTLPRSRAILNKIPEDKEYVYNQLVSDHPYYVQSSVPNEIFQSFLDYWQNDTIPQIDFSNIWYYDALRDEFGLLRDHLSSPEYQPLFDLAYLNNMNQNTNLNKANIEKRIAHNLDSYLINQSDNLCQIPINSLYNIFNHPERNLTDYDRAYQFIVDNGRNLDENFFILLGSLDANKFSQQENKRDALIGRKSHHGFEPENADSFVFEIEQQLQHCRQQIDQLQKSLDESDQRNELQFAFLDSFVQTFDETLNNEAKNSDTKKKISYKIVVAGDSGVGKSVIVGRLFNENFKKTYEPTIGIEFKSFYQMKVDDKKVSLQVFDTSGAEKFRSISKSYFKDALGAVLVFDLTNRQSFENLKMWINDLINLCTPNAFIVLIGNKKDLEDERKIFEDEAQEFAKRFNCLYLETSAKICSNVKDAFEMLGQGIAHRIKDKHIKYP